MAEAKAISYSVNIIDEAFDKQKSDSYHLSILADEKDYACAILDTHTNKYLSFNFSKSWNIEKTVFKSVTCAIAHTKFTLIPSSLFDDKNKQSLLGFNHEVKNDEEVFVHTLHTLDAKVLFTVSASLVSEIRNVFPAVGFVHPSASFIEGLLVQHKNNSGKKVFANFYSSYFEIVILDGKELLFCNAFKYLASEEVAYYILFVYEQLNLNPDTVELILSGEIEKTAKEHTLLYTYIRNVKFAGRPDGFNYSYKFEEIPSHKFFSLFTQYLCA